MATQVGRRAILPALGTAASGTVAAVVVNYATSDGASPWWWAAVVIVTLLVGLTSWWLTDRDDETSDDPGEPPATRSSGRRNARLLLAGGLVAAGVVVAIVVLALEPAPSTYVQTVNTPPGARTFTDPVGPTGEGLRVDNGRDVRILCKKSLRSGASTAGQYWYLIADAPWSGRYYTPANVYLNGDDPESGTNGKAVDEAVPDCAR